jgi:hypothetical protein
MRNDWNYSPPRLPPVSEHSTKEIEHRFTDLEAFSKTSSADQEELHEIVEKHGEKLTLHERVLLGLLIGLATLLQDKFPHIAAVLKTLIGS